MHEYMKELDSKNFCNYGKIQNESSNEKCIAFYNGLLSQGYIQTLYKFLNYYSQLNVSITKEEWNNESILNILKSENL